MSNATETRTYRITSRTTGIVLGDYAGESPAAAIDAMARDAGYDSQAHALEVTGADPGDLEWHEV